MLTTTFFPVKKGPGKAFLVAETDPLGLTDLCKWGIELILACLQGQKEEQYPENKF